MKIQYLVEVELPMAKKLIIIPNNSIEQEELRFINMRDNSFSHRAKVESDHVRALLKYAACVGGKLHKMEQAASLKVTIAFETYESFREFVKNVHVCVESARMK